MKQEYIRPALLAYNIDNEVLLLTASEGKATKDPVLSKSRDVQVSEDFEEEDIW